MRSDPSFLIGGGAVGALIREMDWGKTALAEPNAWPQSLRSAVSIMLNSRYPMAIYWGAELTTVYNDAWSSIPGRKHPWALGRPAREVWPEIWDSIGPLFRKVLTTGEGVWQEDELLPMHRHGYLEECYFNFTFSPIRDESGRIGGVFNAVVETTQRVLAERRLQTLSRLGERSGTYLDAESMCARAAGVLSQNEPDVPFAVIYLRENQGWRRVANAGQAENVEAPHFVADGEVDNSPWPLGDDWQATSSRVMHQTSSTPPLSRRGHEPISEVVIAPILASQGSPPEAFLIAGANPRRRVDDDYLSFFELAAGHIGGALSAARSYEEEQKRAAAMAELDRAKTQFFSNVSHEFRTPLTLMLGPLEDALKDGQAGDQQRANLELAHRNALRLLRLVNGLLDFSRVESGRVQATFRPTDLAQLTSEIASVFTSLIDRAGLNFTIHAPPLAQPVYVDHELWETVLLNLLTNAFKFTLEGEIELRVAQSNDFAVVTVRDTGVGIPETELPNLFKRFHRVQGAKGRSIEGSGIGLALVAELVDLHGGHVGATSREGVGSTFTVSIPFGTAHLPKDKLAEATPTVRSNGYARTFVEEALRWLPTEAERWDEPSGATRKDFANVTGSQGASVLLVDDNIDLRAYIGRILAGAGYHVSEAADGSEALVALERCAPHLVITDVMMPNVDGIQLVAGIRASEKWRNIPVIVLSARAGDEAAIEGLDAGADDYLTKPFSGRELLARVSANIRLAELRREAVEAARASERRVLELNATLEQRVEAALAERRLFAQLVEETDAFVQVADMEFRWLAINRAAAREFERIFGVVPQVGRSMLELLAHLPDQQAAVRKVWGRALSGEEFTVTGEFGAEELERRTYEMKYHILRDQEGQQIGAYQFVYDVTDRVREQARLHEAEDKLRQAQKMEAMGQLTGGVAHDFNNLLTPIVGALDILQRKCQKDERDRRLIDGAAKSADRAKILVQRLLAFARRQPLQARPTDIGALISGMADLIESTTGPQIAVVTDVADQLPFVMADHNQLEMALLNLAVNARDAMPDGGTLRIRAKEHIVASDGNDGLATGTYVCLAVADTGIGMDQEVLARAVDPFFSTKGVGKGTGLGLSMVHGLAEQLGGTMRIHSQKSVGTSVELFIPATNAKTELSDGLASTFSKVAPLVVTALLVDDEELVRASASAMLTDLGFIVSEASSADAAWQMMRDGFEPDLLVTDHLMPGMSGTDLARAIRAERPELPIVLVSGFADHEGVAPDITRLVKPFRQAELVECLKSLGVLR